ncbi:beta-N-acetylhexosaminidase [Actinokineospora auranticolor]|uniref:beta-N-acetylhexosaminidase n=1 Tax=Actinokineospora auranticolor TaxID=155976 RepID=A0A2S6GTI7_9PSEU|nr:beta-N-acetylhexosaminidase [Actinokineospora auranticolor]PPK68497.1 hexosaminidase [Actinokineospora auranticolor]
MIHLARRSRAWSAALVVVSGVLVAGPAPAASAQPAFSTLDTLLPKPVSVRARPGASFRLDQATTVSVPPGAGEVREVADLLGSELRPATGYALPVVTSAAARPNTISLRLTGDEREIGPEGYRLDVTPGGVTVEGATAAGLRNGAQTVKQLLPARIESERRQPGPWTVPGARVVDRPRYAYRGVMLDVARYFYPPDAVRRFIDQVSTYKYNHLHLHLTDDQGWRIQIDSWPRLATYGGSTATGGGPGGYYTKAEYRDLVEYARRRGVTVVPEIDIPGHTTAALASYAELNCDGVAPPLYTGYDTGFSSLCLGRPVVDRFVDDVIREVAALTPGQYVHVGGDEVQGTPEADYVAFMDRAAATVAKYGKRPMGWNSALEGRTPWGPGSVSQYWYAWPDDPTAVRSAAQGAKLLLSPANRAYLDMKYTVDAPKYGQTWAGLVEAADAYGWDPDAAITDLPTASVLGVEATMFTQVTPDEKSLQFMLFPRLPELAEVAWTPKTAQNWTDARVRVAAQAERWDLWGVNYYRSPQIPWPN